jgi:hypothetical protein
MTMRVTEAEFIQSSAQYLEELSDEPIFITRGGQELAVLAKPGDVPISDSLVGTLKDSDVKCPDDIKRMRLLGCMKGLGTLAEGLDIKSVGHEEIAGMFELD